MAAVHPMQTMIPDADAGGNFGEILTIGDVDDDDISDIVSAIRSDRNGFGRLDIVLGRETWPAQIDLGDEDDSTLVSILGTLNFPFGDRLLLGLWDQGTILNILISAFTDDNTETVSTFVIDMTELDSTTSDANSESFASGGGCSLTPF